MINNRKLYKLFVYCVLACVLTACVKTPEENMKDLRDGKVGVVISGCIGHIPYKHDEDLAMKAQCSIGWDRISEKSYKSEYETGAHHIYTKSPSKEEMMFFLAPGQYTFSNFHMSDGISTSYSYYPKKGSVNLVDDFTLRGGEVIYVGHFDIDLRRGKYVAQAVDISNYAFMYEPDYLVKTFPEHFKGTQFKLLDRSVKMKAWTDIVKVLPMVEPKKQ